VINGISPDGTLVNVTIHSRPGPNVALPSIPLANLEVGTLFISDTDPLPVVITGPLFTAIRGLPPGNADYQNDSNPFRKAVSYFLAGVWDSQSRIPYLTQSHRLLINSDEAIQETANRFLNNIQNINPRFLQVYGLANTTIDDILPTLTPTSAQDHDAGVYLVILDRFRKNTTRFGLNPHAYIGKSKDIGNRIGQHNSTANGKSEDGVQEVHRAMREADRHRWFKLASHARDEGVSDEIGNAMREVMESTFMMLFGTMSSRVMVSAVRNNDDTARSIAENYDIQEMARLFTDLSTAAFTRAGYYLPASPNRTQPFGLHRYGCNITIPLGGESANVYERTVWVRQDRGDQWTFHRSPLKFPKDKHIATLNYTNHEKRLSLIVQPTEDEIENMGIERGDEYRMIWEVRKPGQSTHPVPFMRLCDIGCWSNWSYANKVALKIVFYSKKERKWKTKYFQRQAQHHFVENCSGPGALTNYSLGVGLYCYFMRCRFPAAQAWMANFGFARIVNYNVDSFTQTVTVVHFNASADDGLRGPTYSADVARKQMQDLGLQNVNATWKGFNWSWLTDPRKWKGRKVGTAMYSKGFKRREKCDYCLFSSNVSCDSHTPERSQLICVLQSVYSQIHSQTNKCKQIPGTNICEPCAKMGRPCSWTDMPALLGVDTWLEEVQKEEGGKKKGQVWSKGDLHKALVKALISPRYAKNALETAVIDESTGKIVTVQQQEQQFQNHPVRNVDRSQLSQQQQVVFDSAVASFMELANSMRGMNTESDEYRNRMNRVAALVDMVATRTDLSDMVRAALNWFIYRYIRPFMINGYIPVYGG